MTYLVRLGFRVYWGELAYLRVQQEALGSAPQFIGWHLSRFRGIQMSKKGLISKQGQSSRLVSERVGVRRDDLGLKRRPAVQTRTSLPSFQTMCRENKDTLVGQARRFMESFFSPDRYFTGCQLGYAEVFPSATNLWSCRGGKPF